MKVPIVAKPLRSLKPGRAAASAQLQRKGGRAWLAVALIWKIWAVALI